MRRLRLRRIKMWILTRWKTKRKRRGRAGNTHGIKRKRYTGTHARIRVIRLSDWVYGTVRSRLASSVCVWDASIMCVKSLVQCQGYTWHLQLGIILTQTHIFSHGSLCVYVCERNIWEYDCLLWSDLKWDHHIAAWGFTVLWNACVCVTTNSRVLYITYWFIDVCSVQSDGMEHADVSHANCLSSLIIQTKHTYTHSISTTPRQINTHLHHWLNQTSGEPVIILLLWYFWYNKWWVFTHRSLLKG